MKFDLKAEELILNTILGPNKWLAIGLANNLLDADVIQWVTATTSDELLDQSTAYDKISVKGVLLQNPDDHL